MKTIALPCPPPLPAENPQFKQMAAAMEANSKQMSLFMETMGAFMQGMATSSTKRKAEEEPEVDGFAAGANRYVPGDVALYIWENMLKHDPDCGKDAWKSLNVSNLLKKWTGHPSASMFGVPIPDPDLEELTYPEHVELEKKLVSLQWGCLHCHFGTCHL